MKTRQNRRAESANEEAPPRTPLRAIQPRNPSRRRSDRQLIDGLNQRLDIFRESSRLQIDALKMQVAQLQHQLMRLNERLKVRKS